MARIKMMIIILSLIISVVGGVNSQPLVPHSVADEIITYIQSPDTERVAVRIEVPKMPRYQEGAPVVVEVSTWFVFFTGFHRVNETTRIGAITVSYMWPERQDPGSGAVSEGVYDYGGPISLVVLRDVVRFASGQIPDIDGFTLDELIGMTPLFNNVGLFASSHSGVVATNVLAHHGSVLDRVQYLVGRENPTRDEMYPLELGYFDDQQNPVFNSFYDEADYSPTDLTVDYSTVGWYDDGISLPRPCFGAKDTLSEHILYHERFPRLYGKRTYSRRLTQALLDNGALTLENWPEDLSTPQETQLYWPFRTTVNNYTQFKTETPNLKVMLVFGKDDHVQAAISKPHIHQAWDGFRFGGDLWVRMNPDLAYVQSINPSYQANFPDNDANAEPLDWFQIRQWGFPVGPGTREDVWLASVAEMADRIYTDCWDANLDSVFYPTLVETDPTFVDQNDHPKRFSMISIQNYPNPFNPSTTIQYSILYSGDVRLSIFNIIGKEIITLIEGNQPAGGYEVVWDGKDRDGHLAESGIYFVKIQTGEIQRTKKITLVK